MQHAAQHRRRLQGELGVVLGAEQVRVRVRVRLTLP